ncbi:MAG TPA: FkbM family methyltransferase [Rhizomicrobium sp.]|nr:FkbM family methyltransferase [Rhizomicrobium sp.]
MASFAKRVRKRLAALRAQLLRKRVLAGRQASRGDAEDPEYDLSVPQSGGRNVKKLEAVAAILRCSPDIAAKTIFERSLAAMPNRPLDAYLLPSLSIKQCARISEELVEIRLDNGRGFVGHRSNLKEYLLYQTFSRHLPETVSGDAYKLALDIERRYFGTSLPWFCPPGGVYVEGGCFTGMRAIRWHDLAQKPLRILAVEIGESNSEVLRRNIEVNGLGGIIVPIHAGLWSASGTGKQKHSFSTRRFLESTDRWEDHLLYEEEVRLITIDDLLDEQGVPVADYVNIQVNGAEIEVLKGVSRSLERIKVLSVAAYYSQNGVKNATIVERMLSELGCSIIQRTELGRVSAVTPKFKDEILALRERRPTRKGSWQGDNNPIKI